MKLIVAQVVFEYPDLEPGQPLPKPEGCAWYPDARVFVRHEPHTPRWVRRKGAVHDVFRAASELNRPQKR